MSKLVIFWIGMFYFFELSAKKELNFFVDVLRFRNIQRQFYIEVYVAIDPTSVEFQKQNTEFQNITEFTIAIYKDKESIIAADKFALTTTVKDTQAVSLNFMAWEHKRFMIPSGNYKIEVRAKDLSCSESSTYAIVRKLELQKELFSDVLFVEKIARNSTHPKNKYGYLITPLITNATFIDQDTMKFWLEIYQMDTMFAEPYYFEASIKAANAKHIIDSTRKVTKTQKPKELDAHFFTIPIRNLPSQTYILSVEMKTNDGKVLATKFQKFFVYNSQDYVIGNENTNLFDIYYGYQEEELDNYLKTLVLLATPTELNFLKSLKTYEEKKNFFVNFWSKRVEAGEPATKPWRVHLGRVQYANEKYSSALRKGYLTDRGRTLILYGPPNDIQSYTQDGDKFPYEIWFYNKLGVQKGVIFVFYDPDLVTNEYPLIHSNKIGEFNNKSWRNDIIRGKAGTLGADDPEYNKTDRLKFRDTLPLEMR